jgi:hypothetical protein
VTCLIANKSARGPCKQSSIGPAFSVTYCRYLTTDVYLGRLKSPHSGQWQRPWTRRMQGPLAKQLCSTVARAPMLLVILGDTLRSTPLPLSGLGRLYRLCQRDSWGRSTTTSQLATMRRLDTPNPLGGSIVSEPGPGRAGLEVQPAKAAKSIIADCCSIAAYGRGLNSAVRPHAIFFLAYRERGEKKMIVL